jgi:MoaA/NifB/PqqE/SkfB family radical SAM enzyme
MMFSTESLENLRQSVAGNRPLTGPIDLQILPTTRCNAACVFCPLQAADEEIKTRHAPRWLSPAADLSGGLVDRLLDDLYHLGGLRRVHITGGEPLLYRHLLPLLFGFRQSFPQVELTVVTNGILLEEHAAALAKLGLARLSVSINAGTEPGYRSQNPAAGSDDFAAIIRGLKALSEAKQKAASALPLLSVTAVLTRANAGEVKPLFEICLEAGANALTFIPLMEIEFECRAGNRELVLSAQEFNRFQQELDALQDRARGRNLYLGFGGDPRYQGRLRHDDLYATNPCYAGYAFAMVWPNGDVRPCCNCEELMGNLTQQSFPEIWYSKPYQDYRDRLLRISALGPPAGCACAECGYLHENRTYHEVLHE